VTKASTEEGNAKLDLNTPGERIEYGKVNVSPWKRKNGNAIRWAESQRRRDETLSQKTGNRKRERTGVDE